MSPQVATKRQKRRPRRSLSTTGRPSKLVLLGDPKRRSQVERALKDLEIKIVRADDQRHALDAETIGVIVVAPLTAKVTAAQTVQGIRGSPYGRGVPVFAVVPDETTDRSVRQLYADGATAVFQWPREALLLARLVAELLGITLVRGRAMKPRAALTRAIKAHLRLTPWSTSGVRVKALYDGQAQISGSVQTYWRKKELEQVIARVPGVKRVSSEELWVEPSGLADSAIGRAVRSVLRNTTTVDEATISVAVHDGLVALAGTVADRRELRRVLNLVANVKGVRGLTNSLVVSSSAKRVDRTATKRINALLLGRFPDERIKATVFADVAVLSGTVSSLERRNEIEALIDDAPFITRVVNKLDID